MVAALLRSRVYDNEFMAGEYVRRLRLRIEWERQPAPTSTRAALEGVGARVTLTVVGLRCRVCVRPGAARDSPPGELYTAPEEEAARLAAAARDAERAAAAAKARELEEAATAKATAERARKERLKASARRAARASEVIGLLLEAEGAAALRAAVAAAEPLKDEFPAVAEALEAALEQLQLAEVEEESNRARAVAAENRDDAFACLAR
jgi:hypothetical protein